MLIHSEMMDFKAALVLSIALIFLIIYQLEANTIEVKSTTSDPKDKFKKWRV